MSDLRSRYFDATPEEQRERRRSAKERRKAEAREAGRREREERERQQRQEREAAEAELPAVEEAYHDAKQAEQQSWDALIDAARDDPVIAAYLAYHSSAQHRQRAEDRRNAVQRQAKGQPTGGGINASGARSLTELLDKLGETLKREHKSRR